MKKCFLLLGSLVALGGVAFADDAPVGESDYCVYWMVDENYKPADVENWGFDIAQLVVVLDDEKVEGWDLAGGVFVSDKPVQKTDSVQKTDLSSLSNLPDMSQLIKGFYIEFYNSETSESPISSTDMVTYDEMKMAISNYRTDPPVPYKQPYSGWSPAAVPEPTSGLLLVLGCGLLGLRRKRSV